MTYTNTTETTEPTLTVGAANDVYEQQADDVANQIMRMPEQPFVQRKCACEDKEQVQRKPLTSLLQRKADAGGSRASQSVTNQIQATKGGGTPLPATTRSFMESRFGTDFSSVNLHTGSDAVQLSRELNAQAFTVGNDIYFNSGKFAPDSSEGKQLLAHELTHTVQQGKMADTTSIQRASLSEMWGAFWGAGPIDSYRANKLADEALARAQNSGLPGLHNGPADAYRHCYWNCRMTEVIGEEDAEDIADNHESHGGGPAIENMMDQHNNAVGRASGGTSCHQFCYDMTATGGLWMIDSGRLVPSSVPAGTTMPPNSGSQYKSY